jgi:hypothetical protein
MSMDDNITRYKEENVQDISLHEDELRAMLGPSDDDDDSIVSTEDSDSEADGFIVSDVDDVDGDYCPSSPDYCPSSPEECRYNENDEDDEANDDETEECEYFDSDDEEVITGKVTKPYLDSIPLSPCATTEIDESHSLNCLQKEPEVELCHETHSPPRHPTEPLVVTHAECHEIDSETGVHTID